MSDEPCEGCNGNGMVGNILDTTECPFCNGTGFSDPLTRAKEPNIDKAAASIAKLVDDFTGRCWNDAGRDDFARIVKRRLSRFWPQ